MTYQNRHSFVQESRLERWFGREEFEMLQRASAELKIPVPVMHVPDGGAVYAVDGMFVGQIAGGTFSSLSDLLAEASAGKQQNMVFSKDGLSVVSSGFSGSLWRVGPQPASAAVASALPNGDIVTRTTAGALGQQNAGGGETQHLTTIYAHSTDASRLLVMYDRLWQGLISTGTGAQTCTLSGYPSGGGRYDNGKGNFAFVCNEGGVGGAALTGTANWTMVYTDDAGNTGQSTGAVTGVATAASQRLAHAGFALPLLAGDLGIQDIETITASVSQTTGSPTIVLAQPLALIPLPAASQGIVLDGINSAFNLVRILDDAAIAFLTVISASGTTTFTGMVTTVYG